jgi:UDP-3-O-[3-hydroxymyristoyl] glucosamine N-acyltransferase
MKFTAEQIAGILEGEVIGNPNAEVHVLSKIEEGKEGSLTFCQTQNTTTIYSTEATITIVNKTFVPESALKRP